MSHDSGHHEENPMVCYQVGLIFIAVLATLAVIGFLPRFIALF